MKKPTLEQLVARTTNILANLVTVIQKRGDYNLDEYSNKIAALYSSQEPQSVSTPTEGMELSDEELELTVARILADCDSLTEVSDSVWELYRREAKEIIAKVLSNLPTEQDTRIKNLEIQLKNWQEFYVADVKPSTFEQEIREKTLKEIKNELEQEYFILHSDSNELREKAWDTFWNVILGQKLEV